MATARLEAVPLPRELQIKKAPPENRKVTFSPRSSFPTVQVVPTPALPISAEALSADKTQPQPRQSAAKFSTPTETSVQSFPGPAHCPFPPPSIAFTPRRN